MKKARPVVDGAAAVAACATAPKKDWEAAIAALHALPDDVIAGIADVQPVQRIVREAKDPEVVRSAIYWLGRVGAKAAPAVLDIAAALPRSNNPRQSAKVLIALGAKLTPQLREVLRAQLDADSSEVAGAARTTLVALGDEPPEIPIATRIARVLTELQSRSADTRWSGLMNAKKLGPAGAALIGPLQALGKRLAPKNTVDDRVELDAVREALLAIGCAPEDLPRPPSRLEAYRGETPREREVRGRYVIGEIASRRSHGVVSVPAHSLGLWDHETGKLLFVAEGAAVLDLMPGHEQAAIVRTTLRPQAKHGGTSRADFTWTFERLAIPSGARVACLELPKQWTAGWPSSLVVKGNLAKLTVGDEDAPFTGTIRIGPDGDAVVARAKRR